MVRPAAFDANASSHPLYPMSPAAMQVSPIYKDDDDDHENFNGEYDADDDYDVAGNASYSRLARIPTLPSHLCCSLP